MQTCIKTGFAEIDAKLGGLMNSDLICVAAPPATGKTTFALNLTSNVIKNDIPVMFFSLELGYEQVMNKLATIKGDIVDKNIFIHDKVSSIYDVELTSTKMKYQQHIGLIVIDYLQLIQMDKTIVGTQELEEIIKRLKRLAKELNVPIVVLSQLLKPLEEREDYKPALSDFKESSSIVNYADTIMFLFRDNSKDEVSIIVAKSNCADIEK